MKNVYEMSEALDIFDVEKLSSLLPKEFTSNSFEVSDAQQITKFLELRTEKQDEDFMFVIRLSLLQKDKNANTFLFDTDIILAKNKVGLREFMLVYGKQFLPSLENFFIELHKQIHAFQKQMESYDISFEVDNGISEQLHEAEHLSEDEASFVETFVMMFENSILPMMEPEIKKHIQESEQQQERKNQEFQKEMDQFLANNTVKNTENEIERVKKEIDAALDDGDKEKFMELHKVLQELTEKENA